MSVPVFQSESTESKALPPIRIEQDYAYAPEHVCCTVRGFSDAKHPQEMIKQQLEQFKTEIIKKIGTDYPVDTEFLDAPSGKNSLGFHVMMSFGGLAEAIDKQGEDRSGLLLSMGQHGATNLYDKLCATADACGIEYAGMPHFSSHDSASVIRVKPDACLRSQGAEDATIKSSVFTELPSTREGALHPQTTQSIDRMIAVLKAETGQDLPASLQIKEWPSDSKKKGFDVSVSRAELAQYLGKKPAELGTDGSLDLCNLLIDKAMQVGIYNVSRNTATVGYSCAPQ